MARILIETYGCTLNQADSRIMGSLLEKEGYDVEYGKLDVAQKSGYDFVIINTCTVKTPTEQKILNKISRVKDLGDRLIVAGCLASASPEKIEQIAPNASILNTENVAKIAEVVASAKEHKRVNYNSRGLVDKMLFFSPDESLIARIPISEGCLSNCAFCETKFARGPLNSFSQELIIKAIQMSVEKGAKEIELTAQDTGAYGLDKKTNVAELLNNAASIEGDFRIRLGMLNPEHLGRYFDRLVEAYKSEKVYKFIHLPVQSGSDKVLSDMKRNYTVEEFEDQVRELRKKIADLTLETDVIVGYPTETAEDFEESISMIERVKPEITNVSKFGARPHAEASKLKQLGNEEIKRRSIEMSRIVRAVQAELRKKYIGTTQRVLITEKNERSLTGRNDSYISVAIENTEANLLGTFQNAKITGSTSTCLIGNLL